MTEKEILDEVNNEEELCNHESHFISSMSRCEKCGDDRE